ncbi:MAG TPA: MBL fold metallo-hydrolase [Thermoanaerobaculia bacterium]|nr:MBL fold metallo-hydrolase [Thermoanaerobaculia bacterium]
MTAPPPGPPPDCPPEARALYAPHGRPGAFFNPWRPFRMPFGNVVRWWLSPGRYDKSAPPRVPRVPWDGRRLGETGEAAVTWIGHASFALEDGRGGVALTDPHFGPRALLPRRHLPPGVPLAAVPEDAVAVVSHDHYDHLDRWTVRRLPASTQWLVPLGLGGFLRRRGARRVVELDWWQSARAGPWTVACLPAQHWSNRVFARRNGSLWCSWLLSAAGRTVYFAGDTGAFPGFAEIGRRFPGIDLALLPIGAWEPRWFMGYQHLDPKEAYDAFLALGARAMIGMHWGCFDLTDEPIDLAPRVLAEAIARRGGDPRVRTLAVGERWPLPPPVP